MSTRRFQPLRGQLEAKQFQTLCMNPADAVAELRAAVAGADLAAVLFFCSPLYDLPALGAALAAAFGDTPLVGCTSSGQLGPLGIQSTGLVAVGLHSKDLKVSRYLMSPLSECAAQATRIGDDVQRKLATSEHAAFGLILVDGLSLAEEKLTAALYQSMGRVPLVGGSAGDDLRFERTFVYDDGRFIQDAATFALFQTSVPFQVFKFQHFVPSDQLLVITKADPDRRVVSEINGKPAAEVYADLVGVRVDQLDSTVFSNNPVIMELAGEHYVRSIYRVTDDGCLSFFCAIEEGLVLSLARATDAIETARTAFNNVSEHVSPQVVIGCDCVLRRLEYTQTGTEGVIGDLMSRHRVIGFSTYGEQYNSVHVNQTFTGVAIGG
jgi:hypothetical protein